MVKVTTTTHLFYRIKYLSFLCLGEALNGRATGLIAVHCGSSILALHLKLGSLLKWTTACSIWHGQILLPILILLMSWSPCMAREIFVMSLVRRMEESVDYALALSADASCSGADAEE